MNNTNAPHLDAKNLTYLEDSMTYEALASKKCTMYAASFNDPALKNLANQLSTHHKQHYNALLSYLQSHQ